MDRSATLRLHNNLPVQNADLKIEIKEEQLYINDELIYGRDMNESINLLSFSDLLDIHFRGHLFILVETLIWRLYNNGKVFSNYFLENNQLQSGVSTITNINWKTVTEEQCSLYLDCLTNGADFDANPKKFCIIL